MGAGDARERYQPDTKLEAGLGGERWLATDSTSGKVVVLSVLDARAATDAHRAMFETWTRVGKALSHPSLEKVLAAGETALGNPYFATDVVETETLAQRMVREPAMSLHELVRVVTGVVDGLVAAHKVGLAHGDISPERVHLLAGGRARLVGFGLNRAVSRANDHVREASSLPITDGFMSPEQARGGLADPAADLWGVAAILYRGFTGIAPRALPDGRSTVASIAEGPTVPVEQLREDAPPSFATLLDKALAADPSARFKDVAELRKALTSALILAPIVARMPVLAAPEPRVDEEAAVDTSAPALPPPPSRPQTGIGPLGARTNQRSARAGASRWATGKNPSSAPPGAAGAIGGIASGRTSSNPAPASTPFPAPERPAVVTSQPQAIGKIQLVKAASNARVVATEVQAAARRPAPPPLPPQLRSKATSRLPAVSDPPPPLKPLDDAPSSNYVEDDDGVVSSFSPGGAPWPQKPSSRISFGLVDDPNDVLEDADLLDDELDETTDAEVDAALDPVAIGDPLPRTPSSPLFQVGTVPAEPVATPVDSLPETEFAPDPPRVVVLRNGRAPLPPKAWAAIAIFALGCFVAASGAIRWIGQEPEAAPVLASTGHATTANTPVVLPPPLVAASIDAGVPVAIDAGVTAVVAIDAGVPTPPIPEPEVVAVTPTPRVRPPRTTNTSGSTTTVSTTPMTTTTTPMTTTTTPMTTTTTPMTTTMSTHTLERDPGF